MNNTDMSSINALFYEAAQWDADSEPISSDVLHAGQQRQQLLQLHTSLLERYTDATQHLHAALTQLQTLMQSEEFQNMMNDDDKKHFTTEDWNYKRGWVARDFDYYVRNVLL